MKIYNFSLLRVILLLGSSASARAKVKPYDDADTIPQVSRVTAFIITDSGPAVECWAVGELLPNEQIVRRGGSKGTVRRMQMFDDDKDGGLAGVDILTWPSYAPLWPPPAGVHSSANFDFTESASSFTLLGGLVVIERLSLSSEPGTMEAEETSSYFFGPDNGDDWFYFEDSTTSSSHRSAKKASANPSFKVSTVSGGETTLIQFKHKQRPAHKVLHKGACNFAGLVEEGPGQKDGDLGQAGQRQAILEL